MNRRTLILILAALPCSLVIEARAQDPAAASAVSAAAVPALSAEQIVERNVRARGGLEAWRKVKTLSMSGIMDAGKARKINPMDYAAGHKPKLGPDKRPLVEGTMVQVPYVMEYKRPLRSRVEITFNGQTAVQVYDGKSGFKYRPYLNRQDWEPYSAQELRQAGSEQELDGPLIDYAAKGTRIAAEGVEQVEGRDAYKLALKLKSGEERHVWIDAQTFLEVRFDGSRMLDGKPHPVWTTLRDYRPVNGLVIPHLIETSVDGVAGSEKIVIEKVALNPALDDSQFGIPPGSKQAPTRAPLAKAD